MKKYVIAYDNPNTKILEFDIEFSVARDAVRFLASQQKYGNYIGYVLLRSNDLYKTFHLSDYKNVDDCASNLSYWYSKYSVLNIKESFFK